MAWPGLACHGPAQHGAARDPACGTVWNGTARCGMAWYGMEWHARDSMAQHGMAWRGAAWPDMAWHGMAWHGMVWEVAWHRMTWHGRFTAARGSARGRQPVGRLSLAVASFAVASFAVELPSSERGAGLAAPSSLMNHGRREPRVHGERSRIELQPHQHPHPHLPEGTASPAVGTSQPVADPPLAWLPHTQTRKTPRILRTLSAPQAACSMLSAQPQSEQPLQQPSQLPVVVVPSAAVVRTIDRHTTTLDHRERRRETGLLQLRCTRGIGSAPGSKKALQHLKRFLMRCRCGALVEYASALRAATKAGRTELRVGDGCANRGCAHRHQQGRYQRRQQQWRQRLADGSKTLVAWPGTRHEYNLTVLQAE